MATFEFEFFILQSFKIFGMPFSQVITIIANLQQKYNGMIIKIKMKKKTKTYQYYQPHHISSISKLRLGSHGRHLGDVKLRIISRGT